MTFKKFKLLPEIVDVLGNDLNIRTPTPIQKLAIPHLIKGNSALLAAQTGTGKTLAYSLPLIHRLKMAELDSDTQLTMPHRPRSLIIVPTRELAQQVTMDALKPFHY